jgi:hypothetical protein
MMQVSEYGMSNIVGPVYISVEEQQQSPEMQRTIDLEVICIPHFFVNEFSRNQITFSPYFVLPSRW